MFIVDNYCELNINENIFDKYEMESNAYFDIETTGFDRDKDIIMLISLGWFTDKNTFYIKQYYADNICDEIDILKAFKEDIIKFDRWCSYNGKAFDEPFIAEKMKRHCIDFTAPKTHIDLYRLIRPYYKQIGLQRCNLKSVEKYVGIEREDKIDGGISVELYNKYLENKDEGIRKIIMLHNYEDVFNLPQIFKVLYEIDNSDNFTREDVVTEKQLKYLKFLLSKNKIDVSVNFEKLSKKAASKIIDYILKGNKDTDNIYNIIKNS